MKFPHEKSGVGWSHSRLRCCSIDLSVMLSVESESIVSEDHANEIAESGYLDGSIDSSVQKKNTTGLDSVFVRYVGIK